MSSTNQSPEFLAAQKKYMSAGTDEEKLKSLEEMLSTMPSHKGAESLRADLRTRYKKLKEKIEQKKKKKKLSKKGIKKEGVQVVLVGLTQSGKSSLLSNLTNAKPEISSHLYTTKQEMIGTLNYEGIKFQIIDMPAVNHGGFDQGIANTADILLIVISSVSDIEQIIQFLNHAIGTRIIVFNKMDLLSNEDKRKTLAFLQSRKYNFLLISAKTKENLEELKQLLVKNSGVIRIYTKQPGKPADKEPVIMKLQSTVKNVAEKVLKKGIKIKEIRITGPSSKFANQKVGIEHQLKDKDIVEFHAR